MINITTGTFKQIISLLTEQKYKATDETYNANDMYKIIILHSIHCAVKYTNAIKYNDLKYEIKTFNDVEQLFDLITCLDHSGYYTTFVYFKHNENISLKTLDVGDALIDKNTYRHFLPYGQDKITSKRFVIEKN